MLHNYVWGQLGPAPFTELFICPSVKIGHHLDCMYFHSNLGDETSQNRVQTLTKVPKSDKKCAPKIYNSYTT